MKKANLKSLFSVAALSLTSMTCYAQSMSQQEFNDMLLQAFKSDPSIIIQAVDYAKNYQDSVKKERFSKALYYDEDSAILNQSGAITVVEFFDYSCGVCKKNALELESAYKDDRIRFVYKDVSILGPTSDSLAKIAIALNKLEPNKYPAFQHEVMKMSQPSVEKVYKLAEMLNVNIADLKQMASSDQVASILAKNNQLFVDLGLSGTPSYFIGEKLFRGAVSLNTFKSEVNQQYKALLSKISQGS